MSGDWDVVSEAPADPWAVGTVTPTDPNTPMLQPRSASSFGSLLRHPILTTQALASRAKDVAGDALNHMTLVGGASGLLSDAFSRQAADQSPYGRTAYDAYKERERDARPDAARGPLEHIADFGSQLVGSVASPESLVALPERAMVIAGRPILSQAIRSAVGAGLVNAATDPLVQGAEMGRGMQDKYSPLQTLESGVMGVLTGGALGGAHALLKARGEAKAAERAAGRESGDPWAVVGKPQPLTRFVNDVRDQWRAFDPMSTRTPASAEDVWSRLIHRESGGDQAARSPAGAFGVSQLMPDTAQMMAKEMGKPELARLAEENNPAGAAANEMLGKAYYNKMLREFGGDHTLASAAYNAGPGRVRAWIKAFGSPAEIGRDAWVSQIPFAETKAYVEHVAGPAAEAPAPVSRAPTDLPDVSRDQGVITPEGYQADAGGVIRQTPEAPKAEEPIPIPEKPEPTEWQTQTVEPAAQPRDLTDEALDLIRSGKQGRVDQGPSLIQELVNAGGIRDVDGELAAMDLHKGDRLQKMLRRVSTGMDLDEAALWAQQRGFIGGDLDQGHPRVERQELIDAIRREVAGEPVYARTDEAGTALRQHADDLEEMMHHVGLDPHTLTNAQIKAALDAYYREVPTPAAPHVPGDADILFGLGGKPQPRAIPAGRDAVVPDVLASSSGAGGKSGLRGQRRMQGIIAPNPADIPKIEGLAQMAQGLIDTLDLTRRQGRMSLRGALGTYSRRSGVIRTLGVPDMEVLAHEAGHALEFTHRPPAVLRAMNVFDGLLKSLDYEPGKARRHEGFAEFLRWYMTNPEFAKMVAPGFYEAFERAMREDAPQVLVEMQRLQNAYENLMISPSAAVVGSMVVRPPKQSYMGHLDLLAQRKGPMAAISEFASEIYRGMFDKLDPLKRAVDNLLEIRQRNTGDQPTLLATDDPYKMLRMAVGAASAGHMDIMHGVHGYHEMDPSTVGLSQALEMALGEKFFRWDDKKLNQFGEYLASRRMMQEHLRHLKGELATRPALEPEVWATAAADFERANPTWKEAAEAVYSWTNGMWKKRHDAGFLTDEQYEQGLRDHQDYVPVVRDVSDKAGGLGTNRKGNATKNAGGAAMFKGSSERPIINPIWTLVRQAYELNAMIARNDAINALDDLASEAGPGAGAFFERIPNSEVKGVSVDALEAIRNAFKDHGIDERDAVEMEATLEEMFGDQALTKVFRRSDINEKGEPIIYGWKDGTRYAARLPDGQFGRHMLEGLAMADKPIRGIWLDILSAPARALRLGVTAHPQFFVANTIRDQFTAALLTDVGYKPFQSQARGLADELSQAEITRHYNVMGGAIGGAQTAAEHMAKAEADVQALRKKGYPIRRFMSLQGVIQATELSETSTRLGIFRNAYEKAKAAGMSDWDAAREASYTSRDYMDFDRRGGWGAMQALSRIVPFLNASLQAVDKSRRVGQHILKAPQVVRALFGGPPVNEADRKMFNHAMRLWAATSGMAAASLALVAMYADDPEYQEAADYLRDTHWVIPLPNGELGVIPKPFDLAALSNIAERAYEGVALKDPTALKRLGSGLWRLFVPEVSAPILAVPFQLAGNKDAFGVPIVPEHLRNVEPQDQVGEHNSALSKVIGKMFNLSPAQLDYVMKAGTGSVGRDVLNTTDAVVEPDAPIERSLPNTFLAGRFIKDWTRGSTSSKKFWDLMADGDGKFSAAQHSFHNLANEGSIPEAIDRLKKMDGPTRAYVISQEFMEGPMKLAHPLTRAGKISGVVSGLVQDLQQGNVRGADGQTITLTPHERMVAIEGLNKYAVAERRDALIDSGVAGWDNKKPMDRAIYLAVVPQQVRGALNIRTAAELGRPEMAAPQLWAPVWGRLRQYAEGAPNYEGLAQALEAKRLKGRAGAERYLREVQPVQ